MNTTNNKRYLYSLIPILLFILILWMLTFIQWGLDVNWSDWGIYPGKTSGLKGILFSVLLHQNAKHLLANTPALLILGWFLYYFYKDIANAVFLTIWIGSGILTWIFGREAYHIGASGLIYGLAFFLFFSGVFRKNTRLAAISLITVFIYGSLVWNMFPVAEIIDPSVSWEGHLSGAVTGLIAAILFRKKGPLPDPVPEDEDEEEDQTEVKNEYTDNQINSQDSDFEKRQAAKPDSK
ncbi:MAG: rhomboid family intramembrane serine protease [Bacteroidales bacterium]